MPRLARARTGVFDDLSDQLRFAPRAALLLQITRAERLAGEIDAESAYPEDWLTQRVTGYRPDVEEPAMLVGRAVLADLSAFVELLCDRAALTTADLPEGGRGALRVEELCARWGVERKTIDRYRRRGLVARRVRIEGPGGARLLFMEGSVRAFEARHGELLGRAAGFSRMNETERARIERRAARYRARLGWSDAAITARLAARTGRSPGAVGRVLRGDGPERDTMDGQMVFERWRDGASVAELVAQTGRTRAAVHHAIAARRTALLRGVELAGGAGPGAGVRALEHAAARTGLSAPAWEDARAFVEWARGAGPSAREAESARGRAPAALRGRAASGIAGLPAHGRAASAALDRIETDLRWITRLVTALAAGEAALVLRTIEERSGVSLLEMAPAEASMWFERAMEAACGAALRFDGSRGGRLAAPVTIALSHALAGLRASAVDPQRARSATRLADWRERATPWQAWLEPGARAREVTRRGGDAGAVLMARYGLDGGPARTAEEIAREFGVSPARLSRLERG